MLCLSTSPHIDITYGLDRGLAPRDGEWHVWTNDGTAVVTIWTTAPLPWRYRLPHELIPFQTHLAANLWGLPETHLKMLTTVAASYPNTREA